MTFSFRWLLFAFLCLLFGNSASAHYDPRMGRWLSRDPLGEQGGFNLYAYCGNDPVNRHDPLGLSWSDKIPDRADGFERRIDRLPVHWTHKQELLERLGVYRDADSKKFAKSARHEVERMLERFEEQAEANAQLVETFKGLTRMIPPEAAKVFFTGIDSFGDDRSRVEAAMNLFGGKIIEQGGRLMAGGYSRIRGMLANRSASIQQNSALDAALNAVSKESGLLGLPRSKPYVHFNRTHSGSLPIPKGLGPGGGRLQSHHGLQQEWAIQNLTKHGYNPQLAPTITIETGKGFPHSMISKLQNARRDARVAAGVEKWSSSLQDELGYLVDDFRGAGFGDDVIGEVLNQQYKMLDSLNIPYERILGFLP